MDQITPGDPTPGLTEAAARFRKIAPRIDSAYAARKPGATDQITPPQLIEALEQFLTITINLDKEEGEVGPILKDDVTQLGDYGLTLLQDLITWAGQLGLTEERSGLERVTLAVTDWVVRHEGQIRTLEPVVNAFAALANGIREPEQLEKLAPFMNRVVDAVAGPIRQDLEKTNPGRPWRVLNLNRAIVATRSHNTALMEKVFDELVGYLPEDATTFFAQGMQQMDALDYPPHVRAVMSRYHAAWTRHNLH